MDQGSNIVDITQNFMFVYVKIVIWGLKNDPGRVNNSILDTVPTVYQKVMKRMSNFVLLAPQNELHLAVLEVVCLPFEVFFEGPNQSCFLSVILKRFGRDVGSQMGRCV